MIRGGEGGFTLLEMLVVIALFGIAAAVAWPSVRPGGGAATRLRAAVAEATGQIGAAREAAIADGRPRCIDLRGSAGARRCAPLRLEPEVAVASREAMLRFHGDGSSSGAEIMLSADEVRRTLTVVGPTGQILLR